MASTTATASTAKPATTATISIDEAWKAAQKLRAAIHKELEHIQNGGPGRNEMARFEKVEKLMENYRLACIGITWVEIRAAQEKGVEDALWQTHAHVTSAYRKVVARLQGPDNAVLKRKLERLYSTYLKTSQCFYRGYLQRFCARYDMKELRRIARQAELEVMPVPDADKVDPEAAHINGIVKSLCHKMLIYLGDLSRYRTLIRSDGRKWDNALAYYFLANELIPESGFGHHQCGVIYFETKDHLEIVYHLYRSLACEVPHPNALSNLKREFNELQKRKSTGIKHALVNWFVKLHAFYYQGKEFSERKELESEVDHRLAVTMKTGTGLSSEDDLLKIVLINISAYVTAQQKTRAEWTEEGSLSCQYLLLLNIRTIQAISRLLGDEITDLLQHDKPVKSPAKKPNSAPQPETPTKFTPDFSRIIPLLRVYMAWLCCYGSSDLAEFRPYLEPHFGAMCATLSNTLSLLFDLLGGTKLGIPVSWRFPEDDLTIGLRCLNGPDLHDGCQLYYDAFTRKPKPRLEDVSGADYTADDITFTRALDVACCAFDLTEPGSKFPLGTSTTMKGSRELTTVVYLEGGKPDPAMSMPASQPPTSDNSGAMAAMPPTAPETFEQPPERPVISPSPCESNGLSEDEEFYGPSLRRASSVHHAQTRPVVGANQPTSTTTTEFPIEKQLFQILNDFMSPPEVVPTKPETPTRLAAPMTSSMASVPAAKPASTSPASGSGRRTIPTLPWNYFYNPAPIAAAPGWRADGSAGSSRPDSSGSAAQLRAGAPAGNPLAYQTHSRSDSQGQPALVDNQAEALRAMNLGSTFSDRVSQPLQRYDAQGLWPSAANPTRHNAWEEPMANPWRTSQGQYSAADHIPNSPFSNLEFSSNTSSLPPVNSPWGLGGAAARRYASQAAGPSSSSPNHLHAAYPSVNDADAAGAYYAAMLGKRDAQARAPLGAWANAQGHAYARMPSSGANGANQPLEGGDT